MPNPQEKRFARLAVSRGLLTEQQMETCRKLQAEKQDQGSSIPLWDCAVLKDLLEPDMAEQLEWEAGDLQLEELGGFRLVRKLGVGGMGSVYLALGPDDERVALKVLAERFAKQRTFLTRFFREGRTAIELEHENLVNGIDIGEDSGHYYFAMEYLEGKNMAEILEQSGALPSQEASELVLQVARGLAYAHEHGVVHRDIKPGNIMLTADGVAKLTDLGLAQQRDAELTVLTQTGTAMGTPYYMAPEQARDAKRADRRSDIYSLGATWYHMVTGRFPFDGETALQIFEKHLKEPLTPPTAVWSGIPRSVSLAIQRMMAKEPDHRFQTAAEVVEFIRERCLGARDIRQELQLDSSEGEDAVWEVQLREDDRMQVCRLEHPEVQEKIKQGEINRNTPAKKADAAGGYQPAGSFSDLAREFIPRHPAAAREKPKTGQSTTWIQVKELVSDLDTLHTSRTPRPAEEPSGFPNRLVAVAVLVGLALLFCLVWVVF